MSVNKQEKHIFLLVDYFILHGLLRCADQTIHPVHVPKNKIVHKHDVFLVREILETAEHIY